MGDPVYQPYTYVLACKGIIARFVTDRVPEGTYLNLENCEIRQENSISSRRGPDIINFAGQTNAPLGDDDIHSLGRLKSLNDPVGGLPNVYRYAGAGVNLYRQNPSPGPYTRINGTVSLSGERMRPCTYCPDGSSVPYIYFSDSAVMLKDYGTGSPQLMGIFPPRIPCTAQVGSPLLTIAEEFQSAVGFTGVNITPVVFPVVTTSLSSPIIATGLQTATPAAMTSIVPGMLVTINSGGGTQEEVVVISVTDTGFQANFLNVHAAGETVTRSSIGGTVGSNALATISKTTVVNLDLLGGAEASDDDVISVVLLVSDPAGIEEIRVVFDVSDGSFTKDYYWKSIAPSSLQAATSGTVTAAKSTVQGVFNRASGLVDVRSRGAKVPLQAWDSLLPGDDPSLQDIQPGALSSGLSQWQVVQIRRGEFVKVGKADLPGFDWSKVGALQISINTTVTGSVGFNCAGIYLSGGSGLDSFAGTVYDYRYTYYNSLTTEESNPSQEMIADNAISPRRQSGLVTVTASTDAQVTNIRIYRRGGSLNDAWYRVATIANASTTYTDTLDDSYAVNNDTLSLLNDPPVPTVLRNPVATTLQGNVTAGSTQAVAVAVYDNLFVDQVLTVGVGSKQESVVVQAVNPGISITAYFQNAHVIGESVAATMRVGRPVNISTIAFDRQYFAGDPDNPHRVYYSNRFAPTQIAAQNFVDVGKPTDPVMAIVEYRGSLWALTLTTVYQLLGANVPGSQIFPVKTSVTHGLVGRLAWVVAGNVLYYVSLDGIYSFNGGSETLVTAGIDWVFSKPSFGAGVSNSPITPVDMTEASDIVCETYNNKVFFAYTDLNANRKRLIWDLVYQRWYNSALVTNAMLWEQDINTLCFSDYSGYVYLDNQEDYDGRGFIGTRLVKNPIVFTMQSYYQDQGKPDYQKNYNDFYLNIDTQSQNVTVTLTYDNGLSASTDVFTVNTTGRTWVPLKINNGLGRLGFNLSLTVSGSVIAPMTAFEAAVNATVTARIRTSLDTYWLKWGTEKYKFAKQGWFEWQATDAAGITVQCFVEGSTTPSFTFNLPQAGVRTSKYVRLPALQAKLWRFVFTSPGNFQLYESSFFEVKPVSQTTGYEVQPVQVT